MIVYKAINKVNGMVYVGVTCKHLSTRVSGHLSAARRGKGRPESLHAAIREFGEDSIIFSELDTAKSRDELAKKENYWIEKLNTLSPNGYNILKGCYYWKHKDDGRHIQVTIKGKVFDNLKSAAVAYSVSESTFRYRLGKGWKPEQIVGLEEPPAGHDEYEHFIPITVDGIDFKNHVSAANHFGVKPVTFSVRIRKGWTPEQAAGLVEPESMPYKHPIMRKTNVNGVDFDSERQACDYISERTGLKKRTIKGRLERGWSPDEILASGKGKYINTGSRRKNSKKYVIGDATYYNCYEIADAFNMSPSTVRVWLCKYKGKSLDDIFLKRKLWKPEYKVDGITFKCQQDIADYYGTHRGKISMCVNYAKEHNVSLEQAIKDNL